MRQVDQGLGSLGFLLLALALGLLVASIPPWNTATYGTVAQIVTALVAFSALAVAFYSVHAQQQVARRRAALDFFLKTETDDKMLERYNEYVRALPSMPSDLSKMDNFRTTHNSDYQHIRNYLNVLELMALGVKTKALSEVVCQEYWDEFVLQSLSDCALIIEYMRSFPGSEAAFDALLTVGSNWRVRRSTTH